MKKIIFVIFILIIVSIVLYVFPNKDNLIPVTPTPTLITSTPDKTINPKETVTPLIVDKEITFKDIRLEEVIRSILNKPVGTIMLKDVQKITSIDARVCAIHSIDDLVNFTSLERLDLYGNRISDISALSGLTKLKYLNISHNYNALNDSSYSDFGMNLLPLKNLTSLEELYLDKNAISNISVLSGLTNLKKLSLRQNRVTDISPLYRCQQLTYLDIGRNVHMIDMEFHGVKDLSVLSNLTLLTYIDVSENIVQDISCVTLLPNLNILKAGDNEIADIGVLVDNACISELYVQNNILFSFDVILTMKNLRILDYSGNPVDDYYPIDLFEGRVTPSPAPMPKNKR